MTWHFCAVYGCNSSAREQVACTEGCKHTSSNRQCGHPPKRPELKDVKFHPFPSDRDLKKAWFIFLKRKDITLNDLSRNHRVCSIHFRLGLGYCKADPIPSIYDTVLLNYNINNKRKAPRERTSDVKEEKKAGEATSVSTKRVKIEVKSVVSQSSQISEIVEPEVNTLEPLHDFTSFDHDIYQEHSYATKSNTVGTQTLLTGEDIEKMQISIQESAEKLADRKQLRKDLFIEEVTKNDKSIRFYTGFPSLCLFFALFDFIKPVAEGMSYWHGQKNTKDEGEDRKTQGRKRKLTLFEEYVLTFVRLRLGLMGEHLGNIFGISTSTVSKIFKTWINLLYYELKSLISWPSPSQLKNHRPKCFKNYPKTKVVIDCSEFQIEKPKMPTAQRTTWSEYKQRNTAKCLFGISPSGAFTFVSDLWSGSVSDREITQRSGLIELLDPGDDVMADRGFKIRDLLLEKKCTLNIPPSSSGKPLSRKQVIKTRRIASARIHVERAIERIKNFKVLQGVIPLTLKPVLDQIVTISAALCNTYPKLAK